MNQLVCNKATEKGINSPYFALLLAQLLGVSLSFKCRTGTAPPCISWESSLLTTFAHLMGSGLASSPGCLPMTSGSTKERRKKQALEILMQAKANCCKPWKDEQWGVSCNCNLQNIDVQHCLGCATRYTIDYYAHVVQRSLSLKNKYSAGYGRREKGQAITEEKLGPSFKHPRSLIQLRVGAGALSAN